MNTEQIRQAIDDLRSDMKDLQSDHDKVTDFLDSDGFEILEDRLGRIERSLDDLFDRISALEKREA